MMVLFITVVLMGLAVPAIGSAIQGERLRAPVRELGAMSVSARIQAIIEQRTYMILLDRSGFYLTPLNPRADDAARGMTAQFEMPPGIEFQMRSWPPGPWETPRQREWMFPPSGLVEPIDVIFRSGRSSIMQTYDPLTGWVRDESYILVGD
jgi:hypothetical protein